MDRLLGHYAGTYDTLHCYKCKKLFTDGEDGAHFNKPCPKVSPELPFTGKDYERNDSGLQ